MIPLRTHPPGCKEIIQIAYFLEVNLSRKALEIIICTQCKENGTELGLKHVPFQSQNILHGEILEDETIYGERSYVEKNQGAPT